MHIYIQLRYIQIKAELSDTTPKWRVFDGVLLVSAPPSPPQAPLLKVQWSSKQLSLTLPVCPVLVFVVFFLVFGRIRMPGEPLFVERDDDLRTLDIGLLRRHQVSFVWIFPAQAKTKIPIIPWHYLVIAETSFVSHTNHFMRNMSSPVESVAPMILSGTSPRAKPLSFSGWGSDNKTQCQSSREQKPSQRRQRYNNTGFKVKKKKMLTY